MKNLKLITALSFFAILFLSIFLTNSFAAPVTRITICHATSSSSNPYVKITVAANSTVAGHNGHANDIIPPFEWLRNSPPPPTVINYPGKNWTIQGQAIYNNNCNIPTITPTPTTGTDPINGACGDELNTCLSGTYQDEPDTSTEIIWSCLGQNGGTNDTCIVTNDISVTPTPPISPSPTGCPHQVDCKINNKIYSSSNTGKNVIKGKVSTGDSISKVSVSNSCGINLITSSSKISKTNLNISSNGEKSSNSINLEIKNSSQFYQ